MATTVEKIIDKIENIHEDVATARTYLEQTGTSRDAEVLSEYRK